MTSSIVNYTGQSWLDVQAPSAEDLKKLALEYQLPVSATRGALNPEYLPHIETYVAGSDQSAQFVVIRVPEPNLPIEADTIQELTTKIAFFITPKGVISLHRQPLDIVQQVRTRFTEVIDKDKSSALLMALFVSEVAKMIRAQFDELDKKTENFEQNVFMMKKSRSILTEGYFIKRKASSYRKILKTTIDVCQKLILKMNCPSDQMQEAIDLLSQCLFYSEDIYENVQSLLNLHMAIQSQKINEASYKTNETVRVLTIFTLLFLPLNFITGLFGMNFEHIPWLKDINGLYYSMALMMILVLIFVGYLFFKGWLTEQPKK